MAQGEYERVADKMNVVGFSVRNTEGMDRKIVKIGDDSGVSSATETAVLRFSGCSDVIFADTKRNDCQINPEFGPVRSIKAYCVL